MDEHVEGKAEDVVADPPPAPDTPPASDAPPGPPPPSHAPGGIYPAVTSLPGETAVASGGSSPKSRKRVIGLATGAAAVLVAIFLKLALPLLIGTAVSGVLGNVFGGSYGKLPADQQQALERRFNSAIGTRLDGLSDEEQAKKTGEIIRSGLPRLQDGPLVDRLHLTLKILAGTDTATCARVARAITSGVDDKDATVKAVEALDVDSIGRWYDINVQAIEADAASTPVRSVSDADANRILATVVGALTPTEEAQVVATNGAGPVGDEDACGAIRALYRHIEALPPADVAVMALYDAAP